MGKVGAGMKPREAKDQKVSEIEGHFERANEAEVDPSDGVDTGNSETVENPEISEKEETGIQPENPGENSASVSNGDNGGDDLDAIMAKSDTVSEPDYKGQLIVKVTIPEGLEDAVREAAEVDDEGVEGWVQKRFVEYLEAFYTPAQAR